MPDLTAQEFELLHTIYYEAHGEAVSLIPMAGATEELLRRDFIIAEIADGLAYVTVTDAGWRALLS
jgi:hypothetical protein